MNKRENEFQNTEGKQGALKKYIDIVNSVLSSRPVFGFLENQVNKD
jgi:hypothetical protein